MQGLSTNFMTVLFFFSPDDPISVSIFSTPIGSEVNAAEALTLACQATGGTGVFTYQWTSTCSGQCLLTSGNAGLSSLARDAARSSDSGVYTCVVTDSAGNSGNASRQIDVVGM